jgi:hypothetical protein
MFVLCVVNKDKRQSQDNQEKLTSTDKAQRENKREKQSRRVHGMFFSCECCVSVR